LKKRRRKQTTSSFVVFMLLLGTVWVITTLSKMQTPPPLVKNDPFTDVMKYRSSINNELAKYHLEEYTTVLVALMQQESHGKGGDPMQASESAGLPRNTIKNPSQSIELGVKHFQSVLAYGQQKQVDFATIIQAYNMGKGYIDYIAQHGGKHSEELAKSFSLLQVQKAPAIYTCGGDKNNFRYPYCYGDFTYSSKVSKNIQRLTDSVPVAKNQKTTDSSSF
jgi:hypothetical protein